MSPISLPVLQPDTSMAMALQRVRHPRIGGGPRRLPSAGSTRITAGSCKASGVAMACQKANLMPMLCCDSTTERKRNFSLKSGTNMTGRLLLDRCLQGPESGTSTTVRLLLDHRLLVLESGQSMTVRLLRDRRLLLGLLPIGPE